MTVISNIWGVNKSGALRAFIQWSGWMIPIIISTGLKYVSLYALANSGKFCKTLPSHLSPMCPNSSIRFLLTLLPFLLNEVICTWQTMMSRPPLIAKHLNRCNKKSDHGRCGKKLRPLTGASSSSTITSEILKYDWGFCDPEIGKGCREILPLIGFRRIDEGRRNCGVGGSTRVPTISKIAIDLECISRNIRTPHKSEHPSIHTNRRMHIHSK